MIRYLTLDRRGWQVTIPAKVYSKLCEEGLNIGLVLDSNKEPSCVQLSRTVNSKSQYAGTLKAYLGVAGFKNGDPGDFRKSNIISKEGK